MSGFSVCTKNATPLRILFETGVADYLSQKRVEASFTQAIRV